MKTIEEINQSNLKKIISERKHPDFFPGDIVKVGVRITEGKRDRIQYFEGVCIAKKNRDINSSFTVRKISFGEGVERTFALYSPIVDTIKVVRSGKVRRAKLYYLRDRTGKSARIAEKIKKKIGIDIETKIQQVTEENVMPESEEKIEEAPKVETKAETPKAETPKAETPKAETPKAETPKVETKTAQKKAPEKEQKKQEQPKEKEEQKK
jgi:large subunit ribosomal protein L19